MCRVSVLGLAVVMAGLSGLGCGQSRPYRAPQPVAHAVPPGNLPPVYAPVPVVMDTPPVTRQGIKTYEEKVSGLPGQPDMVKRKSEEWYEGPDDGRGSYGTPVGNGQKTGEAPARPPVKAPAPMNPGGQSGSDGSTKLPVSRNDLPPALLGPPVAVKQPIPPEDDDKPIVGRIRVYQEGPNGTKIPARRYNDKGELITEDEDDTVVGGKNPPLPVEPRPLPIFAPPSAAPSYVPTITAPPGYPSPAPTVPSYVPQLPPSVPPALPPLPVGPTLPVPPAGKVDPSLMTSFNKTSK